MRESAGDRQEAHAEAQRRREEIEGAAGGIGGMGVRDWGLGIVWWERVDGPSLAVWVPEGPSLTLRVGVAGTPSPRPSPRGRGREVVGGSARENCCDLRLTPMVPGQQWHAMREHPHRPRCARWSASPRGRGREVVGGGRGGRNAAEGVPYSARGWVGGGALLGKPAVAPDAKCWGLAVSRRGCRGSCGGSGRRGRG